MFVLTAGNDRERKRPRQQIEGDDEHDMVAQRDSLLQDLHNKQEEINALKLYLQGVQRGREREQRDAMLTTVRYWCLAKIYHDTNWENDFYEPLSALQLACNEGDLQGVKALCECPQQEATILRGETDVDKDVRVFLQASAEKRINVSFETMVKCTNNSCVVLSVLCNDAICCDLYCFILM